MKRIFPRLFFILLLPVVFSAYPASADPRLVEKTFSLGKVPVNWEIYAPSLNVSPDSKRMAYMARRNNKFAVI